MDETILTFEAGGRLLALPARDVEEALPVPALAEVGGPDGRIAGLLALRGSVIPVLDLQAVLGLPATPYTASSAVIVIAAGGRRAGILAHRLGEVRAIDGSVFAAPASVPASAVSPYLRGVVWDTGVRAAPAADAPEAEPANTDAGRSPTLLVLDAAALVALGASAPSEEASRAA